MIPEITDTIIGNKDLIMTLVSASALTLGIYNLVITRLDRRLDKTRLEEILLSNVWNFLFGDDGYSQTGDTSKLRSAKYEIEKAKTLNCSSAGVLRYQGLIYDVDGNYRAAIDWYKKSLQVEPNDSITLNWLGLVLGVKKYKEAIICFKKSIDIDPEDAARPHYNLGRLFRRLKNTEQAHFHFNEAVKLRPLDPDLLRCFAQSLRSLGNFVDAKHYYETAVSSSRTNIDAMVELGALISDHDDWDAGLMWIYDASRLDPKAVYPIAMLTIIHFEKGDNESAEKFYARLIEMDPRFRLGHGHLNVLREFIEVEKELELFPSGSVD